MMVGAKITFCKYNNFKVDTFIIIIIFHVYRRALSVTRQCNLPLMVHHSFSTVPLGSDGEWTLVKIFTKMYLQSYQG